MEADPDEEDADEIPVVRKKAVKMDKCVVIKTSTRQVRTREKRREEERTEREV